MSLNVKGMEKIRSKFAMLDKNFERKVVLPSIDEGLVPLESRVRNNCRWPSLRELISRKTFISKKSKRAKGKVFLIPSWNRTIKIKDKNGNAREVGFEVVGMILEFGSRKRNIMPTFFMRSARISAESEIRSKIQDGIKSRIKKL